MSDNVFQFNWRGMTREPSYPYAQPQDGSAQARAAYIANQSANMQGYRPLPNMSGYQPMISGRNVNPDSNPMTQPEIADMQGEAAYKQLEDKLAANEQRIEELKQEYLVLQQEQETATEDLERNVAANRAGIGDTSQYNSWRARVEAREASKQAREADSYASLRQLRNQVDRAYSDISWARGKKQIDEAKADYLAKVDEYNEAARKAGLPEIKAKGSATEETITEFEVAKFAREHRSSNGIWDSPENKKRFDEMAESLGPEGIKYLDEAAYQSNKPAEDAKKKKWAERKAKADKLVRELVNKRMDDTQRRLFNNRWNAGTDEDIKLINEFYNYDTKTGAFSPKG